MLFLIRTYYARYKAMSIYLLLFQSFRDFETNWLKFKNHNTN